MDTEFERERKRIAGIEFRRPGSKHYAFLECDILEMVRCTSFEDLIERTREAMLLRRPYLTFRCNPPAAGRWEVFELEQK